MECFDVLNFPRFAKKVEKYLQNKKNVVPLQSLTKGNGYQWILSGENNIGELAEWSNAAVLKTVDLNGSGGSNPSLSAEKGVTDICSAFFNFSVTKNVTKICCLCEISFK